MATHEEKQAYVDEMIRRGYVLDYQGDGPPRFRRLASSQRPCRCGLSQGTSPRPQDEGAHLCRQPDSNAGEQGTPEPHTCGPGSRPLKEILEAIEISLPEAGVVAFQEGFEAWREVVDAEGIEPSVDAHDSTAG